MLWDYQFQDHKLLHAALDVAKSQKSGHANHGCLAKEGSDLLHQIATERLHKHAPQMIGIVTSDSFLASILMRYWSELRNVNRYRIVFSDRADREHLDRLHEFREEFCFKAHHLYDGCFYLPCYKRLNEVYEAVYVPPSAPIIVASLCKAITLDIGGDPDFVKTHFVREIEKFIGQHPFLRNPHEKLCEQVVNQLRHEYHILYIERKTSADGIHFEAISSISRNVVGRGHTESDARLMAAIYFLERSTDEKWPFWLNCPRWMKQGDSGLVNPTSLQIEDTESHYNGNHSTSALTHSSSSSSSEIEFSKMENEGTPVQDDTIIGNNKYGAFPGSGSNNQNGNDQKRHKISHDCSTM